MWVLSFIPDALLHMALVIMLGSGISLYGISFITKFIPPLIPYSSIIRNVGTLLLILSVYFFGGYSTEMSWRDKVADLEKQVAISEQKSKDANGKISVVVKEKIKYVKETQVMIKQHIKNVEDKLDKSCKVEPEAINILNEAAKNPGVKK
jgi:hypothetical protein